MQLEYLAPPIANNRRISCEEDLRCRVCLATDVAANACGIGNKPRHCVNKIYHCVREWAFSRVNRPLRIGSLLLSWRVGQRNDHITTSMNELEDVIRGINPCQGKCQVCSNFCCMTNCTQRHKRSAILNLNVIWACKLR